MAFVIFMHHDPHVVLQARDDLLLSFYNLRETQELFTGLVIFLKFPIILLHSKPAKLLHVFVGFNIFYFATAPDPTTGADGTGTGASVASHKAYRTNLESGGESEGEEEEEV